MDAEEGKRGIGDRINQVAHQRATLGDEVVVLAPEGNDLHVRLNAANTRDAIGLKAGTVDQEVRPDRAPGRFHAHAGAIGIDASHPGSRGDLASAGTRREKLLPGPRVPFHARRCHEPVERRGIGHSIPIRGPLDGVAVQNPPDRHFHLLARERPRHLGNGEHLVGDVAGRDPGADGVEQPAAKIRRHGRAALAQDHEQRQE